MNKINNTENNVVPVFYACDDRFVKYAVVSISSLISSSSREREYRVYVLNSGLSEASRLMLCELGTDNVEITPVDVGEYLKNIEGDLPIRDYYSKTTYYRFFIAEMFPQYDKAIYMDSDTIIQSDVARLYDTELGDFSVAAAHEEVMIQTDVFGRYCEEVVGVDRYCFFNAGVMLINCESFRSRHILERFVKVLGEYNFVVTQDEDYLNLLCKDRVLYLDSRWNTELTEGVHYSHDVRESYILHFIMTSKPWRYPDVICGDIFWRHAGRTEALIPLRRELEAYTDVERERDSQTVVNLMALAEREIAREDNYMRMLDKKRAPDRVKIQNRIKEYEKDGKFGIDVEDDPPSKMLMPEDIDYLRHGLFDKLKTAVAYARAKRFLDYIIKNGLLLIKEIKGIENLASLDSGAVITCNHFNPFDSFALHYAYLKSGQKRKLYRVIREGNYTNFGGLYGFLMRNFYTLPLSSNIRTLCKFSKAVDTLLADGALISVYPEGSMWYNYRKPKPLKDGAFLIAARNSVPVLPVFMTMRDSDRIGDDGYPVQEYTIHIGTPIYPDKTLHNRECARLMMEENSRVWREIYESEYGIPLVYRTASEDAEVFERITGTV